MTARIATTLEVIMAVSAARGLGPGWYHGTPGGLTVEAADARQCMLLVLEIARPFMSDKEIRDWLGWDPRTITTLREYAETHYIMDVDFRASVIRAAQLCEVSLAPLHARLLAKYRDMVVIPTPIGRGDDSPADPYEPPKEPNQ